MPELLEKILSKSNMNAVYIKEFICNKCVGRGGNAQRIPLLYQRDMEGMFVNMEF